MRHLLWAIPKSGSSTEDPRIMAGSLPSKWEDQLASQEIGRRTRVAPTAVLGGWHALSNRYPDSRLLGRLRLPVGRFNAELLGVCGRCEALSLWEEIWPGPAMKLVGPLAGSSPWLRLGLRIERHCSADEILQGRLIDLVAFVDVDGAPDIPVQAGVE